MEDIDFKANFVARNSKRIQKLCLEGKLVEVTFIISTCATLIITYK